MVVAVDLFDNVAQRAAHDHPHDGFNAFSTSLAHDLGIGKLGEPLGISSNFLHITFGLRYVMDNFLETTMTELWVIKIQFTTIYTMKPKSWLGFIIAFTKQVTV